MQSEAPPQLTADQYIANVKQGVYGAVGTLSTQIINSIEQIFQQLLAAQRTVEYTQGENNRLKDLLEKNKISSTKEPPKPENSKIAPVIKNK